MQFLFRQLRHHNNHRYHHRTFIDIASIKYVKDRGLEHVIQREKHLKPILNIKNSIKSEPSKSLPLSLITQNKENLKIPVRPIELIRKYPSIFQEFSPGGIAVHPHIKLTQQVLDLDSEEDLIFCSDSYRKNVADRVLKLLMISRIHKIPLKFLDFIQFELGLPRDYVSSLVPEFPDCFRVIGNGDDRNLELVCWSNDLAVSCMEKKAIKDKIEIKNGTPLAYPMHFSRDFVMDKQFKKWLNDWQNLPYISPYESAGHLGSSTDESDKWVVGIMHELLNLFVSKKVEKDTLLVLGEWLGIRPRFKRALLHHPGIFYLSKMGNNTVVLREAYKRGMLIKKSPINDVRNQYVHLMKIVDEDRKAISVPGGKKEKEKETTQDANEQGENGDNEGVIEVDDMNSELDDDDDSEYDKDEGEGIRKRHTRRNVPPNRRRLKLEKEFGTTGSRRNLISKERLVKKCLNATKDVPRPINRGSRRNVILEERLVKKCYNAAGDVPRPRNRDRTDKQNAHKFHRGSGNRSTSLKRKEKAFKSNKTAA